MAPPDSARSGDAATQTEPPKVDAGIQAGPLSEEKKETAEKSRPATCHAVQTEPPPEVPSSRPPTTATVQRLATGQSGRRTTVSRAGSKPATAGKTGSPAAASSRAGLQPRRSASGPVTPAVQPQTVETPAAVPDEYNGQPGILFVDNQRTWQQYQESSPQQRRRGVGGSECTPMVYSYNPDPRLRSWQSLEHARLHQLGLSSKLSRRYNVQRSRQFMPVGLHMRALQQQPAGQQLRAAFLPPLTEEYSESARKKNEVAPFLTFQKPTCGYFFSRETENRKVKHGLAPADLPRWGVDLQQ